MVSCMDHRRIAGLSRLGPRALRGAVALACLLGLPQGAPGAVAADGSQGLVAVHPAPPPAAPCGPGSARPAGSLRNVPHLIAHARGHDSSPVRRAIYLEVESLAEARLGEDPDDIEARWWRIAAMGLRVDEESHRGQITLAREIHQEARWILARDPHHAGAHHAMGRLHAGVLRVHPVARFLVLRLVGEEELRGASWEGAAEHLRQAVASEPCLLTHRFELVRVLLDAGRVQEARTELDAMLALEDRAPLDPVVRSRALELWEEHIQEPAGNEGRGPQVSAPRPGRPPWAASPLWIVNTWTSSPSGFPDGIAARPSPTAFPAA